MRGLVLIALLLGLTATGVGLWSNGRALPAPTSTIALLSPVATFVPTATPSATATSTSTPLPSPTGTATPSATAQPPTGTATPGASAPPPTEALPASRTPTAQPIIPPVLWNTATPESTLEITPGTPTVTPTPTQVTPVPTPVTEFEVRPGVVNILLLGSDSRGPGTGWRTDTMIVVSVDTNNGVVSMLSIPRDLFVYIPGYGMNRINTADVRGGPELVRQTLLYNLGLPVHFYARVDFDNFKRIIDAMGGVDVAVDCTLHDWRLKSPDLDPDLEDSWEIFTQTVGIQHMDGDLALWYARSRLTTNDFDRGRRQQQILRALYHTARDQQMLGRVPELWTAWHDAVETDLQIGDLLWLAGVGLQAGDNLRVRSFYLAPAVISWVAPPNGAQVLLPDWERVQLIISGMLAEPASNRGDQERIVVEVWNGTTRTDIDRLAVDRLRNEGFIPAIAASDRTDYPHTVIIDLTGVTKGSKIPRLQEIFDVPAERVFTQVVPDSPVAYRVILGADYDSCRGAKIDSTYVRPTPTPVPAFTPTPAPVPMDTPVDTPVP
jgi:LCP family protein required for cell wall assembly